MLMVMALALLRQFQKTREVLSSGAAWMQKGEAFAVSNETANWS
jgi:hypothetical protein